MQKSHNLLYKIKSYNIYFFALCLSLFIVLLGCSDTDENIKSDSQTETYDFTNINDDTRAELSLQHINNKIQLHVTSAGNKQSMLSSNAVKIFAFFPKDCNMCMPTFIHINNLLHRTKSLQVFILSKTPLHANNYRDFPITLNKGLINLVDTESKFDLFLDSLKRVLNIEIRDYKAPLFILQDTENNITQSIEGVVLEEVLEQIVAELLAKNDTPNSKQNNTSDPNTTRQVPNNTLSQTAPSSTKALESK